MREIGVRSTRRTARRVVIGFLYAILPGLLGVAASGSWQERPDSTDQDTLSSPAIFVDGVATAAGDSPGSSSAVDTVEAFAFTKRENAAFGVGERLVFDISYGFVTAGEAVMSIPAYDSVAGRQTFRVEFTVNSLPSFSWIYKVEDRYLTFIDVEALLPHRFEQHIREGSYRRDFIAEFDRTRGVAETTEGEYPILSTVHDVMSAFYFFRTLDLSERKVGDTDTLHNFYKDKSYDLLVKVLGRQEIEVEAGTFKTVVVEPFVAEGGLFKSEGRIVIWLSDDDLKIPIRVNTEIIIGSIDSELREYSGLVGPLRARTR
ncbi:MAG: DUF3108 domain-containing protein [Bacteroidota bacterium]